MEACILDVRIWRFENSNGSIVQGLSLIVALSSFIVKRFKGSKVQILISNI